MSKKVAIVTGAGRGIGLFCARKLAQEGYLLALAATRDKACYEQAMAELGTEGKDYLYVQANIAQAEDRQRIVRETLACFGRIDLLVNNAGVAPLNRHDLLEMTEESFDRVIGINTKGTLFLTQLVARQMLSQPVLENSRKRGTIIMISSCSAEVSSINRGEYCVSKAGLSMLTTLFADRLAPEGILVHEIRPGVIRTDMTSAVETKYDALFAQGFFPIARWGTPEDVANAVAVFASDAFLYTTGNYVDVDGGLHIKRL